MSGCLHLIHRFESVISFLLMSFRVARTRSRFILARSEAGGGLQAFKKAYAEAWVKVHRRSPWGSKFLETVRSMASGVGFRTPSVAKLSAFSFPVVPLWPFTHFSFIGALLTRRWYTAAFSQGVFGTPTQAVSSWCSSDWLRLCIAYLESVMIIKSADRGATCSATTIAANSPVWLDCSCPGTQIALLSG